MANDGIVVLSGYARFFATKSEKCATEESFGDGDTFKLSRKVSIEEACQQLDGPVVGTCQALEKSYLPLTAPLKPSKVRPPYIGDSAMPMDAYTIYGRFEPGYLREQSSIDKLPIRHPHILSDDELPPFQHSPIDAHGQIRLVSLLPPERDTCPDSMDPIQCSIASYRLADAPAYEALSYTWGGVHRHLPISVVGRSSAGEEEQDKDEMALFATPQLIMALRRLRGSVSRVLWIDQLCINHEDRQEIGPQIQLMGDIYQRAKRVVIWLGEDIESVEAEHLERDGDHVADLVGLLGNQPKGDEGKKGPDEADETDGTATTLAAQLVNCGHTHHHDTVPLRRARAIFRFLNRPWFRRAWVFQEASLARELVVQFGLRQFHFEDLVRVSGAIVDSVHAQGMHQQPWSSLEIGTAGYEMMRIIQQTRQEILADNVPGQVGRSGSGQRFLGKLLQVLRRVECWDKRDLIFAFLAFQDGEGIVATGGGYEQPIEDMWRLAAERIIKTSGSLDIFAAASGGRTHSGGVALPSWVPDWSHPFPFSRPIATPVSNFRASRLLSHVWAATDNPRKLRTKGKIIDRVETIIRCNWPSVFTFNYQSVWLLIKYDVLLQCLRQQYTGETMKKLGDYAAVKLDLLPRDLTRTLLADGALGPQQPLRNVHRYIECFSLVRGRWVVELRGSGKLPSPEQRAMLADYEEVENLILVAENKQIFYTEHFQLGCAPNATRDGDLVAILHGSKTPCILRRTESGTDNEEYTLIGQCYLNGWMYGGSPREVRQVKQQCLHLAMGAILQRG
ncbi:heterokaryon incompatibility protein-domain-containing protein [Chaetomium sp. MPI-CAGE-AT-0009]|nr:heterokaryon incompatibility protein-domain-containing protein [Chaetomium sp. MPI-CAGE-AT-0009]